jgi:hypothetical protein
VRSSILLHSALAGLAIGLLGGLMLLSLLAVGSEILPAELARRSARLRAPVLALCLGLIPFLGAVIGWLEGRLKLV